MPWPCGGEEKLQKVSNPLTRKERVLSRVVEVPVKIRDLIVPRPETSGSSVADHVQHDPETVCDSLGLHLCIVHVYKYVGR